MFNFNGYEKPKVLMSDADTKRGKKRKEAKPVLKKIGIVIFVFVLTIIIVSGAVSSAIGSYNLDIAKVKALLGKMNREFEISEIVSQPIEEVDLDNFVLKSQAAELGIYDSNGSINLEKEAFVLASDLEVTFAEFAAMINRYLRTQSASYIVILEARILDSPEYTLRTVAKLDLSDVKAQLGSLLEDFPSFIYITTDTKLNIEENRIINTGTSAKINNLEGEENAEVLSLIEGFFGGKNSQGNTITDLVSILIIETANEIAQKSGAMLDMDDNLHFLVNAESVPE